MKVTQQRALVGLVVAVLAGLLGWWMSASTADTPGGSGTETVAHSTTDPDSGLPLVDYGELPPEAHEALDQIEAGGPFAYERDGVTFENREGLLPDEERGYYREYTVPTPGSDDRGARRLVTGDDGEVYYTDDHYASFSRVEL